MTARVLVTGAGTGPAENLIKSLRAGDRALFVAGCHADRFELRASAADAKYLIPPSHDRNYIRALRGLVEREAINLLVPTSDAEVVRIARARRVFGPRVFLPRASVVALCQDKYALTKLLRARGIPAPLTYPVRRLADVPVHFRRLATGRAVWCRLRFGQGGLGSLLVETPAQALAWIAYWVRMRSVQVGWFTLSEYLPGRDFSCQSLWREGALVLTKTFERLAPFGASLGASPVAALMKTVNEPRVASVCTAAIRAVDPHASGVYCFDVREDVRGVPCVTEINAGRFSMSTNLYDLVGAHNMATTYLRVALGERPNVHDEYDAAEGYYMVRTLDMPAAIFHADAFADGIEDARP